MKKHLTRFILVGLFSTAVSYTIFLIALKIFSVHYLVASVISFVMTVFFSFLLNKNWTFEFGETKSKTTMMKYYAVYIVSLLLNLLVLRITVGELGIIPEIANILATGVSACNNFIGTKFLVFNKGEDSKSS